jgi:hypothetical protein
VHWREREHEAAYEAVAADPAVMATLTQMWVDQIFFVSIHARATKATECLGRVLAS